MKNGELLVKKTDKDRWTLRLVRQGEELSRVGLVRKQVRIGRSRITTGGIVGLYTPPGRRMEGHAGRLMEASHDFLVKQGCSIALMNAIPDFYQRYGYQVVFPVYRLFARTERLLQARGQHSVRRARRKDEPALVRLYNRCNRHRTGTLVRDEDWRFDSLIHYGRPSGTLLLAEDKRQHVTGYTLCRPRGDRYFVQELNGLSNTAYESLAGAIGRRARRAGFERVHFRMPIDHPFGVYCARFGTEWEIQYHVNAEDMGRILDLPKFLAELSKELSYRTGNSIDSRAFHFWFATESGAAGLAFEHDRIRSIRRRETGSLELNIPQASLLQLALGYRPVSDLAKDPGVRIPSSVKRVMDVLFPQSPANMPMIFE